MKHLEKIMQKELGEILVDEGLIAFEHLESVREEHEATGRPIAAILSAANLVTEWDLAKTVCSRYQLPFFELKSFNPGKTVLELFTAAEIRKGWFLPVDDFGRVVTLAVAEPPSMEFLEEIKSRTGMTPHLFVSLMSELLEAQDRALNSGEAAALAKQQKQLLKEADAAMSMGANDMASSGEADGTNGTAAGESTMPVLEEPDEWGDLFDVANESVLKEIDRE